MQPSSPTRGPLVPLVAVAVVTLLLYLVVSFVAPDARAQGPEERPTGAASQVVGP